MALEIQFMAERRGIDGWTAEESNQSTCPVTRTSTPRFRLSYGNIATHPFDILKIVNGFGLVSRLAEINEGETSLTTRFPVQGHGAFGDVSVLAEQMLEVLSLSVPGEISDENCQKRRPVLILSTISHHRSCPGRLMCIGMNDTGDDIDVEHYCSDSYNRSLRF